MTRKSDPSVGGSNGSHMACEPSLNIVENVTCAIDQFASVAGYDPLSAVSLLIGFLILGVMGLVVAFLGIGAVIDLVRPESNGPPPRQQA
ncbi:MAG: hypothetical protein ACI9EZ_001321 [Halobacteriales archaeon]|jgi:hypothetical protein